MNYPPVTDFEKSFKHTADPHSQRELSIYHATLRSCILNSVDAYCGQTLAHKSFNEYTLDSCRAINRINACN